ncbi:MAG TPA: DUF1844 domain-containing protein [Candidatus Polarisedimenticolia bacterium]|nr:DUF1844 domain-containing protein [Candidatus Polarisedimenticolia bacterium]
MDNARDARDKRQEIRVVDRRAFTAQGEARSPDAPAEEPAPPVTPPRPAPTASNATGARDQQAASTHFKNLILNLATSAAAGLGEIPNPYTQQTEVDLEGARQMIDLLLALQVKTRGNLAPEESSLLESLLFDLQTKFVSLRTQAPKTS